MVTMKDVLRAILKSMVADPRITNMVTDEDNDGFGAIRTVTDNAPPQSKQRQATGPGTTFSRCIMSVCTSFLAVCPILQSSSGEPTRDRELTEMLLNADGDDFILAAPAYFRNVEHRTLNINATVLDNCLVKIGSLLQQFMYSRNEALHALVVQFLQATSFLWVQDSIADTDVGGAIRELCQWLVGMYESGKMSSWKIRDAFAIFMEKYLALDPFERVWTTPDEKEDGTIEVSTAPSALLPDMSTDEDIRVRFRVASANARLFGLPRLGNDKTAMEIYIDLQSRLGTELEKCVYSLSMLCTARLIIPVPFFMQIRGDAHSVPHAGKRHGRLLGRPAGFVLASSRDAVPQRMVSSERAGHFAGRRRTSRHAKPEGTLRHLRVLDRPDRP